MERVYRRTLRRLSAVIVVLCLVVVVTFFTIHTGPVRRYAVSKIAALLAERQIGFQTDELGYNLLRTSIDLKNVRVSSARLPDAPVFATIKRVRLHLNLFDLLRGRYVVESGTVEGVDVHYFVDEQGRDNLPRPPVDPNKPDQPLDYLIAALTASQAHVRYENRAQQIDVELPLSSLDVQGNRLTNRHRITLEGAAGRIQVKDRSSSIDRLAGELDLGKNDLKLTRLNVESEGSDAELVDAIYDLTKRQAQVSSVVMRGQWGDVKASGTVALDASARSQVQADINNVDAGWLMRTLKLPYTVASRVAGKLRAEWPGLDYLEATGDADATLTPASGPVARSTVPLGGRVIVHAKDGRIDAQLMRVTAAGAEVAGRVGVTEDRRLSGQITGRAADVSRVTSSLEAFLGRARGSLLPTPVSGAVSVDARIAGTVDVPSATTTVKAPSLKVGGAEGVALDADVAYTPAAVSVQRADLTWEEARAHVDGQIALSGDRRIAFNLVADEVGVPWLLKVANQPDAPVSGILSAKGTIGGTTARPTAMFALQGSNLKAYEEEFGSLTADVGLSGREVQVSSLVVDKPQPGQRGRISAMGTYHLDRRTYTADVQSENVRLLGLRLPGGEVIRGDVQLAARGSGSVDVPAGTADVTFDSLEIERATGDPSTTTPQLTPVGHLVINAVAENKEATIKASAARFNLNADALVALARPWPTKLTVRAENLDIATLPGLPESGHYEGQLRATVEASGDLVEPTKGTATAAIESFAGSWNGRPFAVKSPSALKYADERLAIEGLEVEASGSVLTVKGELPLTDRAGEGELSVDLKGDLATLTQYLPPDTPVAGDGAVTVTGTLKGTLKTIAPDLVVTIENGLILSPRLEPGFSNIEMRARIANGEATVETLTANWGSATLDASGRIPLEVVPPLPVEIPRMGGPATLKAAVKGLDPAAIPGASAALGGIVTIQADLSATRADLAALNGTVTFPELALTFNGLELAQKQISTVAIASGAATLEKIELSGSAGTITANGQVGLVGDRALNVDVDGNLNAGAISVMTDRVRAEGDTTLKLLARGTMENPDFKGTLTLRDASAVSDDPNIAAENVNADVTLEGPRIVLTKLTGDVNGGTIEGSGSVTLGEGGIADIDMRFATKDFAYDAPLDMRSLTDSDIRIAKQDENFVVSGRVTIMEAGLTGDVNFDTGLLASMTARRKLDLTEQRDSFLDRVRFDVTVNTATPILVDNNLARAEARARLRVVGTPYEPGLTGQMTLLQGGEVRLNERRYEVERGVITFVDERRIFPSFDLLLNTTAGNYDINISVTGTPGDTQTTLTSDPTLPEQDIMAMLVTGRTLDDMRGEEFEVAREQVLSYMAGRVGSTLGRGVREATGLSEVRIEPALIANETDPSARLTLGQDLTDELKVVYSTNLTDSSDQIWIAEYDVTRRFQARGVRQSDASYRVDFRHDVRFGGQASPRRTVRERPKVASVAVVSADTGEDDPEVRDEFDVKEGHSYDFFVIRDETKEVEAALMAQGYLQSRIRLERKVEGDQANLTLRVRRGPIVDLTFEGTMPPKKVQDEVRTQWHRGVFDKQRADDGAEALREWLMTGGYLQPKVEYTIDDSAADRRRVVYRIASGPHYDKVLLVFEGASGIAPKELDAIVDSQKLEPQLFTDPLIVTELLARYYRDQGYLAAEIDEPRIEYQGSVARVVLTVREGRKFMVGRVAVTGNKVWGTAALLEQLPVITEEPFLPSAAERALDKLRTLYWPLGYNDMRSDYSLVLDRSIGQVDVTFRIAEGSQSVVGDIGVRGNRRITEKLVRRQLAVTPGQPLDLAALAKSRRNLYDTGAFSVVRIDETGRDRGDRGDDRAADAAGTGGAPPASDPAPQGSDAALQGNDAAPQGNDAAPQGNDGAALASDRAPAQTTQSSAGAAQAGDQPPNGQKPVPLSVVVREVQPLQLRYGASYDTERGIGGIGDISQHNWLGGARVIGLQARYDKQLKDGRVYINQPRLTYLPFETTGSIYFREDLSPPTEITRAFTANRKGASIQQEVKLRESYVLSWGYRYEHARTLEPIAGVLLDETQTVSPLTSTLTRETRDDVMDATKGAFLSHAFSFSPGWLGSDLPYMKYFGQYYRYFALQPPKRKPFTNEILRPRLVFATGVRVGLAKGIGGEVPRTERFLAGGSVSMRGFAQNAVGPIGLDRIPDGGNGLIVLNNELRAPLFKIVDGVVFTDIGNVFPLISDISFDLRQSVGVGLRVRTSWFLLRGDYGVVLDPRPGERRSRFYFSIGQAF